MPENKKPASVTFEDLCWGAAALTVCILTVIAVGLIPIPT